MATMANMTLNGELKELTAAIKQAIGRPYDTPSDVVVEALVLALANHLLKYPSDVLKEVVDRAQMNIGLLVMAKVLDDETTAHAKALIPSLARGRNGND
jgi:hypothetical protein